MKEEKFVKYMLEWMKITTKEEEELKLEREIKQADQENIFTDRLLEGMFKESRLVSQLQEELIIEKVCKSKGKTSLSNQVWSLNVYTKNQDNIRYKTVGTLSQRTH